LFVLFQHFQLQGAILRPGRQAGVELGQAVPVHLLGQRCALAASDVEDRASHDLQDALAAKLRAQRLDDGQQNPRFDLAPLQHADLVQTVGWGRRRFCSHPRPGWVVWQKAVT